MKIDLRAAMITGAIASAVLYAGGALLNVVLAWGAPALVSYIFHVDLIGLSHPFTVDSFAIGLVICGIVGCVAAGVVASVYNRVLAWRAASSAASASPVPAHPR